MFGASINTLNIKLNTFGIVKQIYVKLSTNRLI
jgi:hypothetical protein